MCLWREQCRRQMQRPLSARPKDGFVPAAHRERINRSFDTMHDYREWCRHNLPAWKGYGPADSASKV
jgi:hypothetical protein